MHNKPACMEYVGIVNFSTRKLPGYNRQDISLTLPEGRSWTDYDYLSIWCERANQNFGHVLIPDNIQLPPFDVSVQVGPRSSPSMATVLHDTTVLDMYVRHVRT